PYLAIDCERRFDPCGQELLAEGCALHCVTPGWGVCLCPALRSRSAIHNAAQTGARSQISSAKTIAGIAQSEPACSPLSLKKAGKRHCIGNAHGVLLRLLDEPGFLSRGRRYRGHHLGRTAWPGREKGGGAGKNHRSAELGAARNLMAGDSQVV